MITPGGYKSDYLVRMVSKHLTGEPLPSKFSYGADGLLYLGGGYWRLRRVNDDAGRFLGVCLINPDRTGSELETIERAIALIIGGGVDFKIHESEVT